MENSWSPRALDVRAKKTHPLEWVLEPLEDQPGYLRRKMFGGEAVYMNGRLTLMLTAGEEPWNGVLVVTGREFHAALMAEWKALKPHTVLGKWLYLPETDPAFETTATAIVQSIRRGDARIGIEPKLRKRRRRVAAARRKKSA